MTVMMVTATKRHISEVDVRHDGDDGHCDKEAHQHGETVSPGAEDTCHFLLMRSSSGTGGVIAEEGSAAENTVENDDSDRQKIEVAQFRNIERIEEALVGDTVEHDRTDLLTPAEFGDDEEDDHHEDRIADESLETVGNEQ